MWERTLQDLVRGLRANKKDESKFISKAVDEIRQEIKTDDMELKAGAVLKLAYLDMMGYDMSWAAFHVVEVMSSPRIHLKTVGYLAAAQSFDQETDVLMLATNLVKKDLSSTPADTAVTLNGLSHIVTPELGRDISPELIAMLTHSRPHIRKRAILALYKVVEKYPEALPAARTRLLERLDDTDPSVVAATISVVCELARKRPLDYLALAPQLFHLLTSSSNNWMLIKIVKLFGSLAPHEPRLIKKLQPPITELISTTPAISLLYECVHTCIIGGMLEGSSGPSLAKLCTSKLATFIQDTDQNLKYIALLALTKIVPLYPYLVADYQDTIIASVNDQDISIRMRALDLVTAMANRENLQSIVQQLLAHMVPEQTASGSTNAAQSLTQHQDTATTSQSTSPSKSNAYRLVLAQRIIQICERNLYENINNFDWYISVLVDLTYVANVNIGADVRDQLVDVAARVRGARRYAVQLMHSLLMDESLVRGAHDEGSCVEVLWAAAWICGEYPEHLAEPQKLIPALLDPALASLNPDITAMYIQAALKIFGHWTSELAQSWTEDKLQQVKEIAQATFDRLCELKSSSSIEVQERAAIAVQLFTFILADLKTYQPQYRSSTSVIDEGFGSESLNFPKSLLLIDPLFSVYDLNPVASSAQASVAVPDGVDLDAWFVSPPVEVILPDGADLQQKKKKKSKVKEDGLVAPTPRKKRSPVTPEREGLTPVGDSDDESAESRATRARAKAERLAQQRDDPYYIVSEPHLPPEDLDSIPVVRLSDMPPLLPTPQEPRLASLRSHQFTSTSYEVIRDGEMPEGAVAPQPKPPSLKPEQSSGPSSYRASPIPILSPFPQYEVPDDQPSQSSTPDPIKVVRAKKKGGGKKKKTET